MQGNLSLSPRAKQAFGSFQHLAAAFRRGDSECIVPGQKGQIKMCTGKDCQSSFRRPGSLKIHSLLCLATDFLFDGAGGDRRAR